MTDGSVQQDGERVFYFNVITGERQPHPPPEFLAYHERQQERQRLQAAQNGQDAVSSPLHYEDERPAYFSRSLESSAYVYWATDGRSGKYRKCQSRSFIRA